MNLWGYAEKTPGTFLWKVVFSSDITLNTQWLQPSLAWKILSKAKLCSLLLIWCVTYESFSFSTMKTSFQSLKVFVFLGCFFLMSQVCVLYRSSFTTFSLADSNWFQNRWNTLSFATICVSICKTSIISQHILTRDSSMLPWHAGIEWNRCIYGHKKSLQQLLVAARQCWKYKFVR